MGNSIKPIKPDEVIEIKVKSLPDSIISSFNELITENFHCGYSEFEHIKLFALIFSKEPNLTREEIIKKGYLLNVKDIYEAAGWKVIIIDEQCFPDKFKFKQNNCYK